MSITVYCSVLLESRLYKVVGIGDATEVNNIRLVEASNFQRWLKDPRAATLFAVPASRVTLVTNEQAAKVLFEES